MAKEYKIETIQDVLNAVNSDNLEAFMIDFESFIASYIAMKNIVPSIICSEFTWVDDGKHNAEITLKPIEDNT